MFGNRGNRGSALIGRERHLQALDDAFSAVLRRVTRALFIHGRSGVGKSILVSQYFLTGLSHSTPRRRLRGPVLRARVDPLQGAGLTWSTA